MSAASEKENKELQQVVADQRASQKLLTAALDILKGVYEKAALVQDGQAPPPGFKKYKKKRERWWCNGHDPNYYQRCHDHGV